MRPRYCTTADKENEALVGLQIRRKLSAGFALYMNNDPHGLDLWIADTKGDCVAEIEVKTRGHVFGTYPDLTISTKKIEKIRQAEGRGFLFIAYEDALYWVEITEERFESQMGGRTRDQRDQWDIEMMDHIPTAAFTKWDETKEFSL